MFRTTTVSSLVQRVAIKGQMVHNQEVQSVDTDEVVADEMWSFVQKNYTSKASWKRV